MQKSEKYKKYFVVLGGFLLHLSIGSLYTYNNISQYLIKFMNTSSLSSGAVNEKNAVWILSLSIFGLGSSVTLGGLISNKIGPSMTVLIGGWFMSINIMLMSFTVSSYLSIVILSYGLCTGIGSGIVYGVAIGTACQWFPTRRGTITGIIVSGFGLSAFIFDVVQTKLMDAENLEKLPISYVIMGAIYILMQFIGALFLRSWSESDAEKIGITKNRDSPLWDFANSGQDLKREIPPHNIYLELDYWVMWITFTLLSACFTLIVSMTKEFGKHLKISDVPNYYYLSVASILGALCNAFGRIIWGYLIDRIRYKVAMLILTLSLSIFFGTFLLAELIQAYDDQPDNPETVIFYFTWVTFLYLIPSGIFSIFPHACAKLFGVLHFVSNYGMLFTAYSFGGLITGIIITLSDQNYTGICISGCVMSLLAALVTFIYRGRSLINRTSSL